MLLKLKRLVNQVGVPEFEAWADSIAETYKLPRLVDQVLGLFPTRLPVGVPEFEAWADSIAETYKLPTDNRESIRFTLATIIMHQGAQIAYRSKFFFYLTLNAGAAKQVAGAVFYKIKEDQAALLKIAQETNGQAS